MKTEKVLLSQVKVNEANPRTIKDHKFKLLMERLIVFPKMITLRPVVVDNTMVALGGNMRIRALTAISALSIYEIEAIAVKTKNFQRITKGEQEALLAYWQKWLDKPTVEIARASELTDSEKQEFIIADNASFGEWDYDALANNWDADDLNSWGVDVWQSKEWQSKEWENNIKKAGDDIDTQTLKDRFIVPPLSIFDTRKGYWQDRKKKWREIIGDNGESRHDAMEYSVEMKYPKLYINSANHRKELGISFQEYLDKYVPDDVKEREASKTFAAGVSLFDPVLSEIICNWFTPQKGAKIFDCFAGDTQKGLVFGQCGFDFSGIELRQEQVDINNRVIERRNLPIRYICDDGQNVAKYFAEKSMDLLFSCPPYYDLEVYSDLENDASNQGSYEQFIDILDNAFKSAVGCLKDNSFAVIVVGDVRNKKNGFYYDFCGDIKRIFKEAGMPLYNEIILIEQVGSNALRAGNYMDSRKVGKVHQNVLVFYKGNTKEIKNKFPKLNFDEIDDFCI